MRRRAGRMGFQHLTPPPHSLKVSTKTGQIQWLALGGLASVGGIYCQILSIKLGEVSTVFTLAQTSPLFVVLISALFLRELERVTPRVVLGAALTVGGGHHAQRF